jgi:hypothetical protein
MLTLLINESNPLDGLFANSTTGGVGTVPDISVADDGQAVSVQSFTRAGGIITDSFVAGDVLHIGIGDGVNTPVCYVALSSASPAVGTMPINTAGMVALFAATVANQLSLTLAVVRTRGAYTNTIFSAPIVIRRSAINISTAVPTPSILGTGVAAALQVAINTALGFVRLDGSARLPAVDGSQLTNLPNTGGVTSITGTANEITVTGTTTPTLSLPSALTFTGKTVTGGTFTGGAFNGTVGATTPSTVAGTTGTFSGAVTGATFNALSLSLGSGANSGSVAVGLNTLISAVTGINVTAVGAGAAQSNVSGNSITAIGYNAGNEATGSFSTYLGAYAGAHETDGNAVYIDGRNRGSLANEKAISLIYGTLASTAAAQQLTINAGTVTLNGSAVTATSFAGAGSGLTALNASNVSSGTLAAARMANAGVHTGDATGTFPAITLNAAQTGITSVGTLTGGATGAGFTVALSTSTVTGTLADARLSANVPLKDAANTFTAAQANSTAGAASLPAMRWTGVPFAGTGTTSLPLVYINDANATASTTLNTAGTYFGVNGDGSQDLMNIMRDGVSRLKIDSTGAITASNSAGNAYIGMLANILTIGGTISAINGPINNIGRYHSYNGSYYGAEAGYSTNPDVTLSRNAAGVWQMGTTAANASGSLVLTNLTASGTLSVTGATTLTGNLTSNGAYISTPQAISGNGAVAAVNLTTEITTIANTGTANTTTTLAAGTNGQKKVISFITDGGFDAVITVTNPAWGGAGTITMNDALDNIELRYLNSVWQVFINNGCTLA